MTNTYNHARYEMEILEKEVPDAIILEFKDELLALCEKFGRSGQSGGSAPFTAGALSKAVKTLCLQEAICPLSGRDEEWSNSLSNYRLKQNKREYGVFKDENGAYYIDAIVWKGEDKWDTFTGKVYDQDMELIGSVQRIREFPFEPKTFYIDTYRIPIDKQEAKERGMHFIEGGDGSCYYSKIKDQSQLAKVFKYYNRK